MANIGLIWASSSNGAIGRNGDIPWKLPEDLKRFKALTAGGIVVMGRKTWESLPFKPLPGRDNFVLTRDLDYVAVGATVINHLPSFEGSDKTVWIIGGEAVYREALPTATVAEVTDVSLEILGADAFAPVLGEGWEAAEVGDWQRSSSGVQFRYRRMVRRTTVTAGATGPQRK